MARPIHSSLSFQWPHSCPAWFPWPHFAGQSASSAAQPGQPDWSGHVPPSLGAFMVGVASSMRFVCGCSAWASGFGAGSWAYMRKKRYPPVQGLLRVYGPCSTRKQNNEPAKHSDAGSLWLLPGRQRRRRCQVATLYRDLHFKRERAIWHRQGIGFELQLLPAAYIYRSPVEIYLVEQGSIRELAAERECSISVCKRTVCLLTRRGRRRRLSCTVACLVRAAHR